MTNFEKYFDDLTASNFGLSDGKIVRCTNLRCDNCIFHGMPSCNIARMEWLKSEYEEPKKINIPVNIPVNTPIDAKVLVSVNGKYWAKRHYAGFKDGKHYVWSSGKTSWTCEPDEIIQWEYMKLYE